MQTDERVQVRAEAPGILKEDIHVRLPLLPLQLLQSQCSVRRGAAGHHRGATGSARLCGQACQPMNQSLLH